MKVFKTDFLGAQQFVEISLEAIKFCQRSNWNYPNSTDTCAFAPISSIGFASQTMLNMRHAIFFNYSQSCHKWKRNYPQMDEETDDNEENFE